MTADPTGPVLRVALEAAADVLDDGDLDVTSWTDLAGLPADLDVLAEQLTAIARYARRWVCQRGGFEPSRLCLLQPLAELMESLADGFLDLERLGLDDLADVRLGVVRTTRELRAVDAWVADLLPVVA